MSTSTQPTSVCATTQEKVALGALCPREASRVLTLFDRFLGNAEKQPHDRAEWDLLKANIFEVNWILVAKKGIKGALALIDLDLLFVKTPQRSVLCLTIKDQPQLFLSVGDLTLLTTLLEGQLGRKGLFDYNSILHSTVGALKLALVDKLLDHAEQEWPKELTLDRIHSITGMAITPSGFDDTLEDEAGYGTASLFGAPHIFYPNANLFEDRHIPFAMAPLGNRPVRVYREYEYQSIYTPPHEIVHALQILISDSQVDGWRHEWEASVACLGLLAHIARKYPFVFGEGLAEETMLGFYGAVVWGHSQVSDAVKAGYREWRDSGGRTDPVGHGDSGHAVHHNPVGTWYCKARISIESFEYQSNEKHCFAFLHEILAQHANAKTVVDPQDPTAAPVPRAQFIDLEDAYLPGLGCGRPDDAWAVDLLPIETVQEQ